MIDSTLPLLTQGYAWLPDLRRRHGGDTVVRTRLGGRAAVALHGREAVEFFYDGRHVIRHGALPTPVLDTLFGRGAVHTLDGGVHRVRKDMFVSLLMADQGIEALLSRVREYWSQAVESWAGREVVLFDETAGVLARAVCDWTGLPVSEAQARELTADCVAMVDGFATPGPRHWRARGARRRQEGRLARTVEEVRRGVAHLGLAVPRGDSAGARSAGPHSAGPHSAGPHSAGPHSAGARSALKTVSRHRDADGRLLDARTAAVELLNVIRPTVAIAWFAVFAAHALHRDPAQRIALRSDPGPYARAFAHEVRRFYPFVPFLSGLVPQDVEFRGETIRQGSLVLLDVYGHHHDPALWPDPYRFDPQRFLGREPALGDLIPQGGGDARTGHRCPGEDIAVQVLAELAAALAGLDFDVPEQDLTIPIHRIPTRPRSGFVASFPGRADVGAAAGAREAAGRG
ncbi:cytochrome P450 [Streptomyces sp. ISL-94]|uniref:cytochrome P450 n=1 Tax=Streptomyces sp. ISL-94 TaxID=2819190 RepID=UPI001BEAE0F8|nr:cytochrome P450 [Streptomyces sp. ISL-94]MBT2481469.1 cytochrome P450 [Streptomyces sp. ISL-94]